MSIKCSSKFDAHDLTDTAQAQDTTSPLTESSSTLLSGGGALAAAISGGPTTDGSGAMSWENFLLDPGQFDDFGFGM